LVRAARSLAGDPRGASGSRRRLRRALLRLPRWDGADGRSRSLRSAATQPRRPRFPGRRCRRPAWSCSQAGW